MAQRVAGEQYESITGQLFEIGRQLRQVNGYPFDPEKLKKHLQLAIEGKMFSGAVSATAKVWKTWKTIKLGTGLKTASDFHKEVVKTGMEITDSANDILGKPVFTVAESEAEVELVACSVAELGFMDNATRKDIYVRAEELGLYLCLPEVGPQLRLQYTDQPKREWLIIAMEPITGSDGDLNLFSLKCDGDRRWLGCSSGNPDYVWRGYNRFIFLRRKQHLNL